jgi:hypothetical protein
MELPSFNREVPGLDDEAQRVSVGQHIGGGNGGGYVLIGHDVFLCWLMTFGNSSNTGQNCRLPEIAQSLHFLAGHVSPFLAEAKNTSCQAIQSGVKPNRPLRRSKQM